MGCVPPGPKLNPPVADASEKSMHVEVNCKKWPWDGTDIWSRIPCIKLDTRKTMRLIKVKTDCSMGVFFYRPSILLTIFQPHFPLYLGMMCTEI